MSNFKIISNLFLDLLSDKSSSFEPDNHLIQLVKLNMETNRKLWNLEDSVRMKELGSEHVANTKQEIDKNNQIRNDLIREIDVEITNRFDISSGSKEKFYSESPGMIIDRLAIMFIKLSAIRNLLSVINEDDLKEEYKVKENIIFKQIEIIGNFLDSYFTKLTLKEAFFEIQQPVKIYNDDRIKKYIKILKKNEK